MLRSVFQGNGRRYARRMRTSVWRSTRRHATARPTTRATTFATAAPSTPNAGTNATPPMSTALAAMFTAFIARLARITSAPRA